MSARQTRIDLFTGIRGRLAIGAACLLLLSSCAWWENVYIFSAEPKHKPTPLTELKPTLSVRTLWKADVGKAGRYFFSPAIIGPDVIAAGGKGTVERFVLATGAVVWKTELDTPLAAGVGSDANTTAVVTESGDIIALDSDGKAALARAHPIPRC